MAQNPDPSPEEIAAECLLIQATWSAREKLSRLRSDLRPHYQRCDGIQEEFDAEDYDAHHSERAELLERTR
ncbi:MAG: hypothetical protein NT138_06175 [Planctomycetales bacterium]|nr:hypothetical protein [Planctomycetales bacterium]